MSTTFNQLPFDPSTLPRELKQFYLSITEDEIKDILKDLNLDNLEQLFAHIPDSQKFRESFNLAAPLSYEGLIDNIQKIAGKNQTKLSFLGDGLTDFSVPEVLAKVCDIRGLTTAYTPYQPERSQGTLWAMWLYSSALTALTGFEAINSSFYDRANCLFEALQTATRLKRCRKVLVAKSIYPGDLKVLATLAKETTLDIDYVEVNAETGIMDENHLNELVSKNTYAGLVFPQVNHFGLLEKVHDLTDFCTDHGIKSIAVIDPFHLAENGLVLPAKFGSSEQGCDMIACEGQNLALNNLFGGPGLGIFGIRHSQKNKNDIRSTAGRFVGNAVDIEGNPCKTMVLSTREQHIRREKATSNICSNQAFVAALAGAGMLVRGAEGFNETLQRAQDNAQKLAKALLQFEGVDLKFSRSFLHEFTLSLPVKASELIKKASAAGIQLGIDLADRSSDENLLLISTSDKHTSQDLDKVIEFFRSQFAEVGSTAVPATITKNLLRKSKLELPKWPADKLLAFYQNLGQLNVSPDDHIYPLGSCTMKYNPHINDWAAGLPAFASSHPQALEENVQGNLQILFEIQQMFKAITGLPGVTTQPVAGAQGELVGIKMFQAYHRDRGDAEKRNIILIPRSAHGTNPATATMAGYETKKVGDQVMGIVLIEAGEDGTMNMDQLKELIKKHKDNLSGIMVTNPNTSGIFEINFKEMADLVHEAGGLVYMDGANMNAIAGIVNLNELGVDAVHNNLHKTWTIPHGGGGPGDAIVAVSHRLQDYLPGVQVYQENGQYTCRPTAKSIGSFHRHYGNFAHKVRCHTYLKALGTEGVVKMSSVAVLCARYLQKELASSFPNLPTAAATNPIMHEFIITLRPELFAKIEQAGIPKANIIARLGKLFLDFGLHAPTVSFPEPFGLMIEPTESFSKSELDHFVNVLKCILELAETNPEILQTVPHFTPISRVDEVGANKNLQFYETLGDIPVLASDKISPKELIKLPLDQVKNKILSKHRERL